MKTKKIDKSDLSALKNPIYRAVIKHDYKKLSSLLSTASFDEINDKRLSKQALDISVFQGDYKATVLLLDHGAMPDYNRTLSSWSESTLGRAIQNKHRKIIKLLISRGCDMDTALKCDSRQWRLCGLPYNHWSKVLQLDNHFSLFKFLLECTGRKISDNDWSRTLLLSACLTGSCKAASYLIRQGVPINTRGHKGATPVFHALASQHIDLYKMLIKRGADLRTTNNSGLSLLHVAVLFSGNEEVIGELIDYGLEVNLRDRHNRTPLHYAVLSSSEIVKLLIKRNAELNAVDNDGRTPFHMLFTRKGINYQIIRLLLQQANIDLTISDNKGVTILHCVAGNSNSTMINYMKNIIYRPEIDINARDQQNRTPLDYFFVSKRTTGLITLLDLGAKTDSLHTFYGDKVHQNFFVAQTFMFRAMKLYIAGFERDANIDIIVKNCTIPLKKLWRYRFLLQTVCLREIKILKTTLLADRLTYYDFLHAKRRACITIAKKLNIFDKFRWESHRCFFYAHMIFRKYLWGLKPLTNIESKSIANAEENLNFIFNGCLPNLVVYNIKKYLDIEDMVMLQGFNDYV